MITETVIDSGLRISHTCPMRTHEEIREELIRQLDEGIISGIEVAARLNIAPARITEMKQGKRRVQPDELAPLAEMLGLAGEGLPEGAMPTSAIPLLGDVPAGSPREAIEKSRRSIIVPEAGLPSSAYALKVDGDSMDKVAKDGATIVIDPTDRDLFDRSLFVVRNRDGETTFKQYLDGPARLVPCSTNPEHRIILLGTEEITILGRVILITSRPNQAALD